MKLLLEFRRLRRIARCAEELLDAMDRQAKSMGGFSLNVNDARDALRRYITKKAA